MSFVGYRIKRLDSKNCVSINEAINILQTWRKNQSKYYKDSKSDIIKYITCPNCKIVGKLNNNLFCKKCKKSCVNNYYLNPNENNYLFNNVNDYPHTPNVMTKIRGRQCFPKTLKVATPGFYFIPPKTKHKTGLQIITIPDPIFLNVKMAVRLCNFLQLLLNPQNSSKVDEHYEPLTKKLVVNYRDFCPKYIKKIASYYSNIFKSPLNYFSIEKQLQGKNNIFRSWNISKRMVNAGRATIIPNLEDDIDVVRIPTRMYLELGEPKQGLIKRDPALSEEAFSFVNIKPHDVMAIGFIPELLEGNGGDFDGDEVLLMPLLDPIARNEAFLLSSVRQNILSNSSTSGLKLCPTNDSYFFFYYCVIFKKQIEELKKCFPDDFFYVDATFNYQTMEPTTNFKAKKTLNKMLLTVANVYSSEICVNSFQKLRNFVKVMHGCYSYSVNLEEIQYFKMCARNKSILEFITWFDNEYVPQSDHYFALFIKAGIKLTTAHLYQLIGEEFGGEKTFHISKEEKFKNKITGNFMDGLSEQSYLHHCQTSIDNYVSSKYIGKVGYDFNKFNYSFQKLVIDNLYRLVQPNNDAPTTNPYQDCQVLFTEITDYLELDYILPVETFSAIMFKNREK